MNLHIGMVGPAYLAAFKEFLPAHTVLPQGMDGAAVTRLTQALLQRGHRVTLYTLDRFVVSPLWFHGPQLSIFVGPYRPRRRARDFFAVERRSLENAIRETAPDLLHAHWTYEFALAALDSGTPSVITVRDAAWTILRLAPPLPYRAVRLLMDIQVMRRATHLIAVSNYIEGIVRRRSKAKIHVIPNGIPELPIQPKPDPGSARVFGAVLPGFGKRKNSVGLLRAFAMTRATRPDLSLRMYGHDHEWKGPVHLWAKKHRLDTGVEFIGHLAQMELLADLAAKVDILVHPSLEESFGNVLMESMALGIPVIGGQSSGAVPWVLGSGENGYLTDVSKPQALAAGMLRLVADVGLRAEFRRKGLQAVRERFDIERVAIEHEKVYSDVLLASHVGS